MSDFLPKKPDEALVDLKERLYARLVDVRIMAETYEVEESTWAAATFCQLLNEADFLENLLNVVEKS